MIDEIQVKNLALIREASLEPSSRLTVLTGETGAGKTALVSALKLLMGVRSSSDMVRDGASELQVSGRFVGLDGGDCEGDLVAMRRVSAEGRSRASINGSMASVHELAELVSPSIDLCGQFEHQQLMKTSSHIELLDAWAGDLVSQALDNYRTAYDESQRASNELEQLRRASELSSVLLDEARFDLRRIDEVAPREGEYEELKRSLSLAENAESLILATTGAYEALSGEGGALDGLNAAAAALESGGRDDASLLELASSLREAGYILEDVAATARDYRDRIEFDPESLAQQQERFSQMQGLLRAYGPRMEDVLARREAAAETVSLVDDSAARTRAAQRAFEEAEARLASAADELDKAREQASPAFASEVTAVMARLEMGSAEIVCSQNRLERQAWTPTGPSSFEFLYRPAADMQPRPLTRIASGGEMSRVMLAVKVVLGATDAVDTLVFDEVDAGVGGAVAVALADVLADLAKTHQVIVVTHLAQVAVRGDTHYVVRRTETENGTETQIAPVAGSDREIEIARMLSGSATDASLAHARELLACDERD